MTTFVATDFDQSINLFASPLFAVTAAGRSVLAGSAFVVGPFLALTATHVIADLLEQVKVDSPISQNGSLTGDICLFVSTEEGARLAMKVVQVQTFSHIDIALLHLGVSEDKATSHKWVLPRLQLLPPQVGDDIAAYGFADTKADAVVRPTEIGGHLEMSTIPRTTTGVVVSVHHEKRDGIRLNFPCFETDARFDGGMSGGPVIKNRSGAVCGVICSNLPPIQPDDRHVSYASSLWPIVAYIVDEHDPNTMQSRKVPLRNLFAKGILVATDLEKTNVEGIDGDMYKAIASQI